MDIRVTAADKARGSGRAAALAEAPLAAALAEAQQVMCAASTDYIPYTHTHSHMHWPSKGSDIYIEKERDHSFAAADIQYIGLHLSIVV